VWDTLAYDKGSLRLINEHFGRRLMRAEILAGSRIKPSEYQTRDYRPPENSKFRMYFSIGVIP
ncbi:MAG: hypothetical protein ACE5I5_15025, partial [Candidatus Heimdallarchaeota archaeon]